MNASIRFPGASVLLVGLGALLVTPAIARPSIADLQSQLSAAQTQIATLQSQSVPNLAGYLTVDLSTPSRPTLRVAGANLQIVNGLGTTQTTNGLGNLIVGYNENRPAATPAQCSVGGFTDQATCEFVGFGFWGVDFRSGSHNVVVGQRQNYSRFAGLVVGYQSTINGRWASVSGGQENIAAGDVSSVSGGYRNVASGGGASISGGQLNKATQFFSSVSGGTTNTASGLNASVSGGNVNSALGIDSVVSGGTSNEAQATQSVVSGGRDREATGLSDWVAGLLFQDN